MEKNMLLTQVKEDLRWHQEFLSQTLQHFCKSRKKEPDKEQLGLKRCSVNQAADMFSLCMKNLHKLTQSTLFPSLAFASKLGQSCTNKYSPDHNVIETIPSGTA